MFSEVIMIGFYIFDESPSVDKSMVLAHSALNEGIKGYFYVRESDCSDNSSVSKGSKFFGILDDASGFGACLFIKDLEVESKATLLQNDLHVKGNETVDGNSTIKGNTEIQGSQTVRGNSSINGNLDVTSNIKTSAMITGNSPNTAINLNAAHAALIMSAALSGAPAPLIAVPVTMTNS